MSESDYRQNSLVNQAQNLAVQSLTDDGGTSQKEVVQSPNGNGAEASIGNQIVQTHTDGAGQNGGSGGNTKAEAVQSPKVANLSEDDQKLAEFLAERNVDAEILNRVPKKIVDLPPKHKDTSKPRSLAALQQSLSSNSNNNKEIPEGDPKGPREAAQNPDLTGDEVLTFMPNLPAGIPFNDGHDDHRLTHHSMSTHKKDISMEI